MNMHFNRFANRAAAKQGLVALTNDDLLRAAPSIFATAPHESRSSRFTPIPTIAVIDGLRKEGFVPFSAKQSRSKDETRMGFTKHMVRFRHEGQTSPLARKVGDTKAEVVLVNANDGTSSYQLSAGLFRLVCLNGMVVSDGDFGSIRVGHTGDILSKVIEGTYSVMDQTSRALEVAADWKGITLSRAEQMLFAQEALMLRFDEGTPVKAQQMLSTRRGEDAHADLWTTFNRVQENALRGGLVAETPSHYIQTPEGQRFVPARRAHTREVKGIGQDVKLNKALWALAEGMAKLKGAA
jgi:hypothetical protein